MPGLFTDGEADYGFGKTAPEFDRDAMWRQKERREMSKIMPSSGGGDFGPEWVKDDYVVALIETPDVLNEDGSVKWAATPRLDPNNNYLSPDELDAEYGPRPQGERAWKDKKGNAVYLKPEFQWILTFRALEGEYKDRHVTVWVNPKYFEKDGKWVGKMAAIYHAELPDYDLSQGIEDNFSDIMGVPLRISAEPGKNPQYAKVNDWLPVKKGWKPVASDEPVTAEELADLDSVPF
jgi:hypothetical protein